MRGLPRRSEQRDMTGIGAMSRHGQIAALQGAPSVTIQSLLGDFGLRAARSGHRIAGVVELEPGRSRGICGRRAVRDLSTGIVTSISQDLGPASTACNLDPSGLIEVCAAVERAIAAGADLVILSKFGKLEADRRGLSDAFRAAIGAGLPILTAVAPAMNDAWRLFAGPLAHFIPAEASAVDAWWSDVHAGLILPAYD